jgi:hypothetical protein
MESLGIHKTGLTFKMKKQIYIPTTLVPLVSHWIGRKVIKFFSYTGKKVMEQKSRKLKGTRKREGKYDQMNKEIRKRK